MSSQSQLRFALSGMLLLVLVHSAAHAATATKRARMYFNVGSVDFDLYGNESPLHVANFLGYANDVDGDASRNGVVDGADFLSWQRSSGMTTDASADGDGNYQVDGLDFLEWQQNFGAATVQAVATTVPEPTSLSLAGIAIFLLPRLVCRMRNPPF